MPRGVGFAAAVAPPRPGAVLAWDQISFPVAASSATIVEVFFPITYITPSVTMGLKV